MPLLRNGRTDVDNPWVHVDDETSLPVANSDEQAMPLLLGLERFLTETERGASISGVLLAPEDDAQRLAPYLERLQLIAIQFPVYTDGRGYSHARLLRERLNYAGEIRAVGDVRIDQLAFMMRAGIDAFDLVGEIDETTLHNALNRYQMSYQPSYALAIAG